MFDALDIASFPNCAPEATDRAAPGGARRLILSGQGPEEASEAAAALAEALGDPDAALVVSEEALTADWPQYVVARLRTGGAFVVERESETLPQGALRLARGALFDRPAAAIVVAGQLIFQLGSQNRELGRQAA